MLKFFKVSFCEPSDKELQSQSLGGDEIKKENSSPAEYNLLFQAYLSPNLALLGEDLWPGHTLGSANLQARVLSSLVNLNNISLCLLQKTGK